MRFVVNVDCDNAAFEPDPGPEVARLLRAAADWVEGGRQRAPLRDVNGNTVGSFRYVGRR